MEHTLELGRGMVESRRCDPPRGVQADRPLKILKTGILETGFLQFDHKIFSCSSGNFAGFGNPMV